MPVVTKIYRVPNKNGRQNLAAEKYEFVLS